MDAGPIASPRVGHYALIVLALDDSRTSVFLDKLRATDDIFDVAIIEL